MSNKTIATVPFTFKMFAAALACGILLSASAAHAAPVIGASTSSIAREFPGSVEITVTGLAGGGTTLRLYVDADGDGVVDAEDYAMWTYNVADNGAVWSPNMPVDTNPTAGEITANVRGFAPSFPYAAGTFIWEAEDWFDASKASMTFTVTQSGTQSASGTVVDSSTMNPVSGAIVLLHPTCDGGEEAYRWYTAVSDATGAFSIIVPVELDCHHRVVLAIRPGWLTPILGQHHLVFNGTSVFSGLDVELTPGQHSVTGQIVYETGPRMGQGIPGVQIFSGNDSASPVVSLAFTDEDGNYEFFLADGDWFVEGPEDEQVWVQGASARDDMEEFATVSGGPATVANLAYPAANAYISGTFTDNLGAAVAGRWMGADRWYPCDPDCFHGAALTDESGNFTLGVVGPVSPSTSNYSVSTRDPLEGLVAVQRTCDVVSEGSNITGADVSHFAPTWTISGQITDAGGTPLENICIEAWGGGMSCVNYSAETETDCFGNYVLPAADGNWYVNVYVEDFGVIYRNLPDGQFEQMVTVSGGNVSGVNFVLGVPSFSGRVRDKADNAVEAEVCAYRTSDNGLEACAFTDSGTGNFTLEIPNGEYRLEISPTTMSVTGPTEVQFITVSGATQAEFDFTVFNQSALQFTGSEPRVGNEYDNYVKVGQPVHIFAENLGGGSFFDVFFSNGLGGYIAGNDTIADPARGIILTRVPSGAATGGMFVRKDGTQDSAPAPFTVLAGSHDAGIYTVSGQVTDGVNPVAGVAVILFWSDPAFCSDDDHFLQGYAMTDANGNYSLSHPGGHLEVAFLSPTATTLASDASELPNVFSSIIHDKTLNNGYAVHIRVLDDALPANPVKNVEFHLDSDAGFDFRMTDANGEATLFLVAGDYELELRGPGGSRLVGQEQDVTISGPLDLGDVQLYRGALIGGRAAEQDGVPVPGTEAETWSSQAPYEDFFQATTSSDGTYHGAVPFGSTFQIYVDGPTDNLANFSTGWPGPSVGGNDLIFYPSQVLLPAGFIAGYIRDSATLYPIADIQLHNHNYDGSGYPGATSNAWTESCPDGAYRMKVPIGWHYLHINAGTPNNTSYMEEWFDNALCSNEADALQVNEGLTTTADIYLDPSGSISGNVMGDGQPLSGVSIRATGGALGTCEIWTWTDTLGNYTLSLPAGSDYRVEAMAWNHGYNVQCYNGYDNCWAYTPVSVSAGMNTPNIDFVYGCSTVNTLLFENMETGAPGWTASGLWHLLSAPTCSPSSYSGSWSFYYGQDASCNYDTGMANSAMLLSPVLTNVDANAVLSYWHRRQTDNNCGATDHSFVYVWVNGAGPYQITYECDNSNQWFKRRFDLNGYYLPGDSLQFGFIFDSADANNNGFLGWMIDDVWVFTCQSSPCDPLFAPALLSVEGQNCSGGSITVNTASPTLVWSDVANESQYEWEIYDGANCTGNFVAGGTTFPDTTSPTPAPTLPDGTYSWRVRALGDGVAYCNSIWTCGCPFTVDTGSGCTADAYEPDDDCASATSIMGGETQTHNHCDDPADWLAFYACAGQGYEIRTLNLGPSADTVLYLYEANCTTLITSDDDGGGDFSSLINWTAPADGVYYIRVGSWFDGFGPDRQYDVRLTGTTCAPPCSVEETTFSWIDASGGTLVGPLGDDAFQNIPVGFTFTFYGTDYTDVYVSSNGYLTFGVGYAQYDNSCIPSAETPNNAIYAFWDDLNPSAGGEVRYLLEGTAPDRRLTVAWLGVPTYGCGGAGTFEVTLYEGTNEIIVQYQSVGDGCFNSGASATAGVECADGTEAIQYSCNTAALTDGLALRYLPCGTSCAAGCTPDAYEPDNDCPSGVFIAGGETQFRNFCDNEYDIVHFNACGGEWYTIETVNLGASADAVFDIYAADCGTWLAFGGTYLDWQAPYDGVFVLSVYQDDGTSGPDREYQLTLWGDTSGACGGGAPPEVSGDGSPYPLLVGWNGANVVLTFEYTGTPGVVYNVYEGAPGSYEPLVKTCFIDPLTDPNFTDNGDGTGRYILVSGAPAASVSYLVSASNVDGESVLGYDDAGGERLPLDRCGATP